MGVILDMNSEASADGQSERRRVPRMRTARQIVAEVKALDPESAVSEYCIRQIIKAGAVPVVWAGGKALVNLDSILDLFRSGMEQPQEEEPVGHGIRRIRVL